MGDDSLQQAIDELDGKLETTLGEFFVGSTRVDNVITYTDLIEHCLETVLGDEEYDDGMDHHDIYELAFNVALDVFKSNVIKYSGNDAAIDSEDATTLGSVQILVN